MPNAPHTPTKKPWIFNKKVEAVMGSTTSDWTLETIDHVIARMVSMHSDSLTAANAAFIVRAVNCHEELITVLEDVLSAASYESGDEPANEVIDIQAIQATLAKAKGEAK